MSATSSRPESTEGRPGLPAVDVNEYGGKRDGQQQTMNRRLFMQLLVFRSRHEGARLAEQVAARLRAAEMPGVIYADTADPRGFGLLTWSEEPAHFVERVRPLFSAELADAELRPEFAMLGRTYSSGYEPDLAHWLLKRPAENVMNPDCPWHVWYPLRRTGPFNRLDPQEQSSILREHAALGLAYGQQDLAHDVRLACHGIDAADNEFVIGLLGRDLHPLSHLVQAMRKTRQTSEYIAQMGPFFVGRVIGRVLEPRPGRSEQGQGQDQDQDQGQDEDHDEDEGKGEEAGGRQASNEARWPR